MDGESCWTGSAPKLHFAMHESILSTVGALLQSAIIGYICPLGGRRNTAGQLQTYVFIYTSSSYGLN